MAQHIRDLPKDLKRAKGATFPNRKYVSVREVAAYYDMPYPRMYRRIRLWGVPMEEVAPGTLMIPIETARNLRDFHVENWPW